MYENGEKLNRHANIIRHKKRLKDTQWFFLTDRKKLNVNKKAGQWCCPYRVKWWRSIYDPYFEYNRMDKKLTSRKTRNFYKIQLSKYMADEEFDYINHDLRYKIHNYR